MRLDDVLPWIGLLFVPAAVLWLLPLLSDLLGIPCAAMRVLRRRSRSEDDAKAPVQRFLFLVPAHDEALLIEGCVRSLLAMRGERSTHDVCVIADNCADDTAARAEAAGARVLVRNDPARRGKPYALHWAMERHRLERYDALVIIDADAVVDPGFADTLASVGPLRDRAAQTYNGIRNEDESWLTRLAAFLTRIRYDGQYRFKRLAGLNCPITGNGMCLGTGLLGAAGWPDLSLAEDSEAYLRYTLHGADIEYVPAARSFSQEAHTLEESAAQRRRWQAGRWSVARAYAGRIARSRAIGVRQKLELFADLLSAGPVLHSAGGAAGAALLLLPGAANRAVGAAFALSLLPMALWATIVWIRSPDRGRIALALARLPIYAVWRLGIALRSLSAARLAWERSPRH